VNWQHLRTFLWLRWRLRINQLRRGGIANAIILTLLVVGAALVAAGLFVVGLLVGMFALAESSPPVLMFVWDGVALAFLFFWAIGLLAELQRAEVLSLDKILHLPVSPLGAFLINYVSSLVSVSLLIFLPAMLGLGIGLIVSRGPAMLLLLPLLAAFILMVTALTYQFQGWLAALMVNKRRRRTILVLVTTGFILLVQIPNLLNLAHPVQAVADAEKELAERQGERQTELQRQLTTGKITVAEFQRRTEELDREFKEQLKKRQQQTFQEVTRITRIVNLVVPPGWLPTGAMDLAAGNVLPALLGTAGLALIGTSSLWRSYRTIVRLYTGEFASGKRRAPAVIPATETKAKPQAAWLEKCLPGVSEHASVVAMSGMRSLTRAPEAKMMLLSPIILAVLFGFMFFRKPMNFPQDVRPLFAFGTMSMILLTMSQLLANQFGFDRSGFRVFVLCPASRRDILLGKNLAVAPLAIGITAPLIVLLQLMHPMRWDHFLATVPQFVSMFLLYCLMANGVSIIAPMPISSGSLKPIRPKLVPVLLHVAFVFMLPVVLGPLLLPLGIEVLVRTMGWSTGTGICLGLSLAASAVVVVIYQLALAGEGAWLQAREQKILEVVTTREE
jgi:hypothetical protein